MRCEHCQAITKLEDEMTNQEHGFDNLFEKVDRLEERIKRLDRRNTRFILRLARRMADIREYLGLKKVGLLSQRNGDTDEIEEQAKEKVQAELD